MVDPEAVRLRLREMDRRVTALRDVQASGRDAFLSDPRLQAEAERHLQLAIQAAIDAAAHILAEDFPDTPSSYREVFELLGKRGVLEDDLAARLARAAGLRNILVHAYLEVDPAKVWESLSGIDDLIALAERLEERLGGKGRSGQHPRGEGTGSAGDGAT